MDIDWDEIIVTSSFNNLENRIEFTATIDEDIVPVNDYFLGVEINKTIERARFENNEEVERLEASFDTRINILKRTYPYTLKVVDARGVEQYNREWILYYNLDATDDILRGLWEVIFPEDIPEEINEDTSANSTSENSGSTTTTTTTTTIINDQGEVIGEETTTTIITNGWSVNSSTSDWGSAQTTIIPKPGAKWIYKSQSDEPSKINGIGNNPNYNSWRGQ